jgi:hypothetical protein
VKLSIEELQKAYEMVQNDYSETGKVCAFVLKREILRRQRAGRPAQSKLSKREQNRINQKTYRDKQKQLRRKSN